MPDSWNRVTVAGMPDLGLQKANGGGGVAIYRHSTERTSVLCGNLSLTDVRRFTISELYPHPWRGEG